MKPTIFISYRRSDTAERAHRVADWLKLQYGQRHVFIDLLDIGGGTDFARVIENKIAESNVMIVVIGDQWVDEMAHRSASPEEDFVRLEVRTGLKQTRLLIPLLTDHDISIDKDRLPEDVRNIVRHNFMYARLSDFHHDMEELQEAIDAQYPAFQRGQRVRRLAFSGIIALALLLLVSLAGSFLLQAVAPIDTPQATPFETVDFGVIITHFYIEDDSSVSRTDANRLISNVATHIASELEDYENSLGFSIGIIPPDAVGVIEGDTRAERERNARDLAAQYRANIVLYGVVSASDNGTLLVEPEYYIAQSNFADGLELTGDFRFGEPIQVAAASDNLTQAIQLEQPLSERFDLLSRVIVGLTYTQLHYPREAVETYRTILDTGWGDTRGLEVIYVLLGNAYLKIAEEDFNSNAVTPETATTIGSAIAAYEDALTITEGYARSYVGQGASQYYLWLYNFYSGFPLIPFTLQHGLDLLEEAERAPVQSREIEIQVRRLYWQVRLSRILLEFHQDSLDDDTVQDLITNINSYGAQIINLYQQDNRADLMPYAAEANIELGRFEQEQGDCTTAVEYYEAAADLVTDSRRRMAVFGWIGECQLELGNLEAARSAAQTALEIAQDLGDSQSEETYRSLLSEIN